VVSTIAPFSFAGMPWKARMKKPPDPALDQGAFR
jgi:hypothetical protein